MRTYIFFLFILFSWIVSIPPAWSAADREVAGIVKAVSGEATIVRQGGAQPILAIVNLRISSGDAVRTGKDGSIGLILRDDTVLSLGPETEFKIEDFQFNPVQGRLSFLGRLLHGTINYISGQIAKLAPDNVRLDTPDATLGVRGTQILVERR